MISAMLEAALRALLVAAAVGAGCGCCVRATYWRRKPRGAWCWPPPWRCLCCCRWPTLALAAAATLALPAALESNAMRSRRQSR